MNAIEYSVSVGVFFNEIFMNKNKTNKLTRANINKILQQHSTLNEFLQFFSKWMEEIVSNMTKDMKEEMDKMFMSRITCSNLRTVGFCEYKRIVFEVCADVSRDERCT
jgi:hypothetical protein